MRGVGCDERFWPQVVREAEADEGAGLIGGNMALRLDSMITLIRAMFPHMLDKGGIMAIHAVATRAYQTGNWSYAVEDAILFGNGFRLPEFAVQTDEALFARLGRNFDALVSNRLCALKDVRMSTYRVLSTLRPDNPEINNLVLLSERGMPLMTDPEFIPNGDGVWPMLSSTFKRVSSAVERMFFESFYEPGLAVILRKETVLKYIPGAHISRADWTTSHKPQGRPLTNASYGGSQPGNTPLNSPFTKAASDECYGEVKHPTLRSIAIMVVEFWEQCLVENPAVQWGDVILYKMDLKGAYTLLSFSPSDVRRVAVELSDDKVMFFLCGVFGWTGTPAAFQAATRAIIYELNHKVSGAATMYVDDVIGVALRVHVAADLMIVNQVCTDLLGPDAIQASKTEASRRLVVIGYDIDLDKMRVTISEKNILKAIYGFMSVDLGKRMPVAYMQKLASWGSRYGEVCVFMRPFVRALYCAYRGFQQHVSFALTAPTCRAIRLFTMLLLLTAVDEATFSRDLFSFQRGRYTHVAEFDASLSGIGIIWYVVDASTGAETPLGWCSIDIRLLGFCDDSAHQNTAEFIAGVMSIRGLMVLCPTCKRVMLRGDSVSALTWADTKRFRGDLVGPASMVFILQSVMLGVEVTAVQHIPAEENWRTDMFSRDHSLDEVVLRDPTLANLREVNVRPHPLIELCDPSRVLDDDDQFVLFWKAVQAAVKLGDHNHC